MSPWARSRAQLEDEEGRLVERHAERGAILVTQLS
jgi:hypothetical protein